MSSRAQRPLAVRHGGAFIDEGRGPADAYSRWREQASRPLFEIGGLARRRFHTRWNILDLSGASLVDFDIVGLTYVRDAARIRADGQDDVRIQLTLGGGARLRFGDRDVLADVGTAVFVDHSLPIINRSVDTRGRTFSLPRAAFGRADLRALNGRVASGAAFHRLHDYFRWLQAAIPGAPASTRERVLASMAAVVRASFDPAAEPELQDSGALDGVSLARLRALALTPAAAGTPTADELARAVGMSRAGLYRVMAPLGGVMEIVWAARLEGARAALSDPGRRDRVTDIARAFGFRDDAHFSRRFRDRYGFKPSDLRPIRLPP